ncbi:hypothetical protein MUN74_11025 [Agromyces endophyticus]|uniref:hypothetical protein n=1 Tax=Agromyces sp. H17E-10 TaxID=2932244 RepID=UPI001FD41BFC|nr:hypothetical protein [Agromyces sp. H17E-10]UOQ87836.1 hypothetical protein MUN74_11025 [Agromyces sp. H17E-10]
MTGTEREFDIDPRLTAERAAYRAADLAEDLAEETGERVDDLTDQVEDAADAVGDVLRDVRETATDAIDAITTQAGVAASEAREVLDDGVAYVKARYRENPGVVIAVGAAVVVGVVLVVKALTRR